MKVKSIEIKNILSYYNETIELNEDLNIIVGANGSGKSNLINMIIYILKKFCFRNFEISNIYGVEQTGIKKYSIRQRVPLYGEEENHFLQKHKKHINEESYINLKIEFESQDINNLKEIKSNKNEIERFLEQYVENISLLGDKYQVDKSEIKKIFEVEEKDLNIGNGIVLKVVNMGNEWEIENDEEKYHIYMKYFSLICDICRMAKIDNRIKNPFVFFEAYRNNSNKTTKVAIGNFNNQNNINLQSWENLSCLAYSIGSNVSYITLATQKFGRIMRNEIEKDGGKEAFCSSSEYLNLKQYFLKFGYNINLKCISPEDNMYQFYIVRDSLQIDIDNISSGEREILNFIFGIFLEKLNDSIIIIDEPELHLHPNWQKKLVQILKEETKGKNIQILFTTHSADFIAYNILNNVYRVYKEDGCSKCVRFEELISEDNKDEFRKKLNVINATNNEKIFFSNAVILVEGITDEILFKKIYEEEIGNIPDGLEFISISGKKNLEKFKGVIDNINIKWFYIGDLDNITDSEEFKSYYKIDEKAQNKDLKKEKNQSYACLDLLKSIEMYIEDQSVERLEDLKNNYLSYNERFTKLRKDLTAENREKMNEFIKEKYKDNYYILSKGEIEDYLGTGKSEKVKGFNKVLSFLDDKSEYDKFKNSEDFKELKDIIMNINSKL